MGQSLQGAPMAGGGVPFPPTVAPALTGSDPTLEQFFEHMADMAAICDRAGRFRRVNGALADTFGLPRDAVLSRSLVDFLHPGDRPKAVAWLSALLRQDPGGELEVRLVRPDGGVRLMEWRGMVVGDGICCIGRDITERRAGEGMVRLREQQLSRAQRLAHIGDWRLDLDGMAFQWSDELFRIYHIGRAGRAGPTLAEIEDRVHPDDRAKLARTWRDAVRTGDDFVVEYRLLIAGRVHYLAAEGRPERDGAGRVVAYTGFTQDITDHVREQLALLDAKEAAEAASRAKSDFLASMSHEFRTPLNAIIGFSEIIGSELMGPIGNARYREYIRDIETSGRHLLALVNDMLDMARIEAGRMELHPEPLDMASLAADVLRLVAAAAAKKDLTVSLDAPARLPRLLADGRAVRQVLLNLLSNAVKFTPAQGRVDVALSIQPAGFHLAVSDSGVGIPPERLGTLGLPFVQVENVMTRRESGAGIGLYITRSLMELHGGSLHLDSRQGVGTMAAVLFPANRIVLD